MLKSLFFFWSTFLTAKERKDYCCHCVYWRSRDERVKRGQQDEIQNRRIVEVRSWLNRLSHTALIFFRFGYFFLAHLPFVCFCLRDSAITLIFMRMFPVSCISSILHVVKVTNEQAGFENSTDLVEVLCCHHVISPTAADCMRDDVTSWHSWGAQAGCNPEAVGWRGSEQPRVRWSSLWGSYRTDAHTDAWRIDEEHLTYYVKHG